MNNLFLITAWNDSGAGNLMRKLDNCGELNVMPFETLLGKNNNHGILNYSYLGRSAYRWNIFRDKEFFNNLIFDSNFFEEPELYSWLNKKKFQNLHLSREELISNLKHFWKTLKFSNYQNREKLISSILLTNNYITNLSNYFFGFSKGPILIHVPCMALDFEHKLFNKFFKKTVHLYIEPYWGFGNMHKRNAINLERYLKHWYIINKCALQYKLKFPKNIILLNTENNTDKVYQNSITSLNFFEQNFKESNLKPSILGEKLDSPFYPYGGLKSFSKDYVTECINLAKSKKDDLSENGMILLGKCEKLFIKLQNAS